jgi:hypothetical protein
MPWMHDEILILKKSGSWQCSMLVSTPFALCFVTLCGVFMRFLELTYWQDATVSVPYFLLFLCFRNATQEIFLELDETSSRTPIFSRKRTKDRMRVGGGPEGRHTMRGRAHPPGHAQGWWAPGGPLTPPFRLFKAFQSPNPKWIGEISKTVPQRRRHRRQISGDISLCSGTLPGWGSAPGAISIGLHRCLYRLHWPYRHLHQPCCLLWWGGSNSPQGWGLCR